MRYQIAKVGEPGYLYLEEDDILAAHPVKDGRHAAEIAVLYRNEYRQEPAFRGIDGRALRLLVNVRQLLEMVGQDRAEQTGFCEGCYDHGKTSEPPVARSGLLSLQSRPECTRCALLHACLLSGQGDYRQQIPAREYGPSWVMTAVMILLTALWWWTLSQWAGASSHATRVSEELRAARARLERLESKQLGGHRTPVPPTNPHRLSARKPHR